MKKQWKKKLKKLMRKCLPSYRVALRNEKQLQYIKRRVDELQRQNQMMFWWDRTPPGGSLRQTQQDFFRQMPKAEGDLRMVQLMLAHMLRQFKAICEENDIRGWWLQGGTLLGAVRHQGFVPWDDDVDVGILRGDLDRLCEVLKDHPVFEIRQNFNTQSNFGRISRLMYRNSDIPCFVDLLVYDTMTCEDVNEGWKQVCARRKELIQEIRALGPSLKRVYKYESVYDENDYEKLQQLCDKYRWKRSKTDNAVFWAADCLNPGWKRCFRTDFMFPQARAEFEGETYPVPRDSEAYLTLQYKDIWMLPNNAGMSKHWDFFGFSGAMEDIRRKLEEDGVKLP